MEQHDTYRHQNFNHEPRVARIMISEEMVPLQRPDVMAQGVLEEMVLYDGTSEMGYSLNASARAIWDCCDGTRNVREICDALSASFDIPPDLLLEDVQLALRQLLTLGLISDNRKNVPRDQPVA